MKHGRGDVCVEFTVRDGLAELRVSDNGSGFAQDFDGSGSAHTGLELVDVLIRRDLSGQIAFENGAKEGAVVRVTIPLTSTTPV
jgi:two-component sensor histidine kinase